MGKAMAYSYYMISCNHSDSTVVEYHIMGVGKAAAQDIGLSERRILTGLL